MSINDVSPTQQDVVILILKTFTCSGEASTNETKYTGPRNQMC